MARSLLALAALWPLVLPCPAPACSFCPTSRQKQTFRQEVEQARLVLYGYAANPRLNADKDAAPGSGTTEFHVVRVLKPDPGLGERKVIPVARYIPVLDPKAPPHFVAFCDVKDGRVDVYQGRTVTSPALLAYLEGARAFEKDRTKALLYYFRFLDHEDETVAQDAFLELARSADKEIGEVMRHLPADRLRRLIENPKTPPEALSLYAFLLGGAGGDKEEAFLRAMLDRPDERMRGALDGVLGGYINLRPKEGWDRARAILGDGKKQFTERFAVTRTVRFFQGWQGERVKKQVLPVLETAVADGELADLGVEDLRRWKWWDLTPTILAQYERSSHASPIVRRAILRYALSCPLPEARAFADRVRRQDAELVRDVEESMRLIEDYRD